MTKNYHGQPGIPRSGNDWGVMLLAVVALICGAVLILSDKASVSEASVITAPAWALIGVQKGRRPIRSD
ncbi:hypothetical protein ACFWII_39140 [Streptomyces sp. NPDC127063]|uniref:hypothetical protein n=1 Tax=Streptomyces sp. NPDC127063 TaxID=3347123 RepID=UPI00364C26D9